MLMEDYIVIHERQIFPPSGPTPGVLQTKDKTSLLRCANKHRICDSSKDKRQKSKNKTLRANHLSTYCETSALAFLLSCLLRCAHKHYISALKVKDKKQEQNHKTKPCKPKYRGEIASIVLVICCGSSHHECHACYASHISTK